MSPASHSTDASHDPLIGRDVGGYVVEEPIGEGGMGLVYRARHPILNRRFAIKVLRPEAAADASVSGNFVREAQTLSGLRHPHIIDIVGFGPLDETRQYMVMEFLDGRTLQEELDAVDRMSPERALDLADQILDALSAAHAVNVVHRDLKPSNVFLARVSGGGEVVKLLDFGLAKAQPEAMNPGAEPAAGASVLCGTPEYVAPEQALGKAASRSSDLYSFGVMFFQMLTGELPFKVDDHAPDRIIQLMKKHLQEPPPSLASSSGLYAFPEELEATVAELLKKDPHERLSNAIYARSRLDRVRRAVQQGATKMQKNPLLAAPPSALSLPSHTERMFEPFPEERRRGRAGLWLALAAILLGAIGVWWSFRDPAAPAAGTSIVPSNAAPAAAGPAAVTNQPSPEVVVAQPARKAAVSSEPDLLAPLIRRPKPAAPTPPLRVTIGQGPLPQIRRTACEPNARWKKEATSALQELQQAAASSSDPRDWGRFERAEPGLTANIASATTGEECEAVERDLHQLAGSLSKPGTQP
jgi:serine/threonine-protein kinase